MAWDANDSRGAGMKRYDSSQIIRAVLTIEQKQWLQSKAAGMQSMSDVIRAMIAKAMDNEQQDQR